MNTAVNITGEELERLRTRTTRLASEKSYLELVNHMMNSLSAVPGLDSTVDAILRLIVENIGGSNVALYYRIGGATYYADVIGDKEFLRTVDDEIVRRVFESGRCAQEVRPFAETRMATAEFTKAASWALPLIVAEQTIAVLKIEDMLMWSAESRDQLGPFFNYAALVLNNEIEGHARLMAARAEADCGKMLLELYEQAPRLTEKQLYDFALQQAIRLSRSEIGFFHRVSDDQENVIITAWSGETLKHCTATAAAHYPIADAGNWVDCIRLRRPVIYNDYATSPNRKGLPAGHSALHRFMSVPVLEDDKVRIIFGVGNKVAEYDDKDVVHIQLVANELQKIIVQRRVVQALHESEMLHRSVMQAMAEGLCVQDADGRILAVNPAAERIQACASGQMLGGTSADAQWSAIREDGTPFPAEAHPSLVTLRTGQPQSSVPMGIGRPDGSFVWISINSQPLIAPEESAAHAVVTTFHDITERKRAVDEIRRLNAELEERVRARTAELETSNAIVSATLESTAEGILAVDETGQITCLNERFREMWRVPPDLAGIRAAGPLLEFLRPQLKDAERVLATDQELAVQPDRDSFDVLETTDGRAFERCSRPQRAAERIIGRVWSYRDITERRELESQLRQAHKLEAVGQLAGGIAHEINTPTQFVSDNTRFLQTAFPKLQDILARYRALVEACRSDAVTPVLLEELETAVKKAKLDYLLAQIPEALSDSLEGLERVTRIVRAMKEFAHPDQSTAAPADLNRAIESTVTVARNEWKYVADMQLDLDPDLPPVLCLLADFNQVVLNIVVNAAHAIKDALGDSGPGKGTITITTRHDDDHVEVRIGDTGTGIAEAHRDRVFDQFFTTKKVGQGTGQGLAISRRVIVEKHHGTLTFETEMGKGTTFIIRLPLTSDGVEAQPPDVCVVP